MNLVLCVLALVLLYASYAHAEISCRDENNRPIDWYTIYKLPKLETEPPASVLGQGEAYAVLNISKSKSKWILSEKAISSHDSILGNTLRELYDKKNDVTYLLYNDDPEDENAGTSAGHTKGVLVFDEDTGFWLIHSIPRFPPADGYIYPTSGLQNGQSALCITFKTEELNEIGKQLLYNHPNIYDKGHQTAVLDKLDEDSQSLFSEKPKFIRKPPFTRIATLTSAEEQTFTSFAKDNQYDGDLYEFAASKLRASLYVETWRRGSGTPLAPSCEAKNKVEDVKSVNITVYENSKARYIAFQYTEDHSKWAVSSNTRARSKWVCVGDINRMQSQSKRGGGTVCFTSSPAWKAYISAVAEIDHC